MSRFFNPEIHDPILTQMVREWKRTDQDIAEAMGFDRQTITIHRERLRLPRNHRPRPEAYLPQEVSILPKGKQNPLQFARMWLRKRLVEKPSGYWLDNVPVNLTSIMRAANRAAQKAGAAQLDYNPEWLQ